MEELFQICIVPVICPMFILQLLLTCYTLELGRLQALAQWATSE
jgi:hypothetical protein